MSATTKVPGQTKAKSGPRYTLNEFEREINKAVGLIDLLADKLLA